MKLNLKGAITGALAGGATGGWAGAGAGAGAGLFSADEAADAKSAYNRQLSDSIMLWNMQNAYNTPLQQRKRLEEAGYNPNLWYTQGNTGNSSTISQPTLSYAQSGGSPLQKVLNSLSVKSAKENVKSNELDNEYKQLRLDYLKAQIAKLTSSNAKNPLQKGSILSRFASLFVPKYRAEALDGFINDVANANYKTGGALGYMLDTGSPNSTASMFDTYL